MRARDDLAHAVAFLTRLPVPGAAFGNSALDFSRQVWAFPLAGALVAAIAGLLGWGAFVATSSAALAAIIVIATAAILTGALHEDGLADCADGFWGGRDRQCRLAIMRDSAIGTYGVLALVLIVVTRVVALAELAERSQTGLTILIATVAAFAIGKVALALHWTALDPAGQDDSNPKGESLATRFGRPGPAQVAYAALAAIPFLLPLFVVVPPLNILAALVLTTLTAAAVTSLTRRKIGGFTGDSLGATALIAETAFLCGLLAPSSLA